MEIIALIGLNGSGKSTVAELLKKELEMDGKRVIVDSLAKPLKELATKYLGYDENLKRSGHRDILEDFAFDMKQGLGKEIFAYACLDRITSTGADIAIIDDLRYIEEVDILGNFIPMHIIKLDTIQTGYSEADKSRLEAVENYLITSDFVIYTIFGTTEIDTSPVLREIMYAEVACAESKGFC